MKAQPWSLFSNIQSKDFKILFLGQTVSYLGNMVTYTAVPYQVYELTKSSFMVGVVAFVELAPLVFFGILGGSIADRWNRQKLVIISEIVMVLASLGLVINANTMNNLTLPLIFIFVFLLQTASVCHRPAIEAMTQLMVTKKEYPSVAALGGIRYSVTAIVGPAIGGWLIHSVGLKGAYIFDLITFILALITILALTKTYSPIKTQVEKSFWQDLVEGLKFAKSSQPLFGSYLVDILAMAFAFPVAIFPQLAETLGEKIRIGWLYAGMAIGSLVISFYSQIATKSPYRGKAIILSAVFWGVAILGFGFANTLLTCVIFLAIAGAFDAVNGLNRRILWNEIIPNNLRGRLAGLEMISFMSGPLIGNLRAGTLAEFTSIKFSIISGGIACIATVLSCIYFLPLFWKQKSS